MFSVRKIEGVRDVIGRWAVLTALAGLLVALPFITSPTYAGSFTAFKADPIVGSGTDSTIAMVSDLSSSLGLVKRITKIEPLLTGDNITKVRVEGTKVVFGNNCFVFLTVAVANGSGVPLAAGSTSIPRKGTTFSKKVTLSNSVYYHLAGIINASVLSFCW